MLKEEEKKFLFFFLENSQQKDLKKTEMNCDGIRGAMVDIIQCDETSGLRIVVSGAVEFILQRGYSFLKNEVFLLHFNF